MNIRGFTLEELLIKEYKGGFTMGSADGMGGG